ncbi:MAG: cytochrome c peroxidase [Caldilineaceae bacterium]
MHGSQSDRYHRRYIFPIVLCLCLIVFSVSAILAQGQTGPAHTLFLPLIQGEPNVDAAANGNSPAQLRRFIDQQVGGIQKFKVPATDADIPTPRLPDGAVDPLFKTTPAKVYLGKQLFHDPVRAVRIRPAFGGVPATAGTSSCGSCHLGEEASRAGTLFNFAAGGEGRGYTDANGKFIARRRPNMTILPKLRDTPLFPGDLLVDRLPTLQDVYKNKNTGEIVAGSPALQRKLDPNVFELIATGRLDALDSVGRNAPSVIGAAFNNRLLQGGFAGEPDSAPGGLNPFGFVAQESVALLLLDAHRMLDDGTGPGQSDALKQIPAFVKLFQDAFPEEAAQAAAKGDMNLLINNLTALRATASFMRTVLTRNTPWDRFLAGDNNALTLAQRRGAKLFFTSATAGGAGCFACHSGPMLNKQVNDPDVAGVGQFVEENFFNLGLADHPLQALNRTVRGPNFRDDGRREITGKDSDAFKFRVLTLRQLKDSPLLFHNGSFTRVKDVVKYFNAGIPQDAEAAAAGTLTPRFTNPRGPGLRGLGLNDDQVNDLTDFIVNGLYDPSFVNTFMLTTPEMTYSKYRPDLAALGAKDGFPISGLPQDNNDALSRRDMGLEFLDVTAQVGASLLKSSSQRGGQRQEDAQRLTNTSSTVVDTHLLVIVHGLPAGVQLVNASGKTTSGDPYLRVFLSDGVLNPGQSIVKEFVFERKPGGPPVSYTLKFLSGQGNP